MAATNRPRDRVTDEQIIRARSVNLIHFLQRYEPPGELRRIGQSWTLKSHDSIRISDSGLWNWFSQSKGGGDAISFLREVHGMSFQEAVRTLAGEALPKKAAGASTPQRQRDKRAQDDRPTLSQQSSDMDFQIFSFWDDPPALSQQPRDMDFQTFSFWDDPPALSQQPHKPPPRTAFTLPPKNGSRRRVFAYLCARGIDPEIINHCFRHGLLYEDAKYHNAVFVGYDKDGTAKYAALRGTTSGSNFKREQTGSDKSCGFCVHGKGGTLYVCEAAIDALSVATLRKLGGKDWRQDTYLSLGGVTASKDKLPVALERALRDFSFNRIVLCMDNDAPGQAAARRIFRLLHDREPRQFEVNICTPRGKDFNDQLCFKRAQNVQPPPSRGRRENTLVK